MTRYVLHVWFYDSPPEHYFFATKEEAEEHIKWIMEHDESEVEEWYIMTLHQY